MLKIKSLMPFVIEGEEKRPPVAESVSVHLEVFRGRHYCVTEVDDHDQ